MHRTWDLIHSLLERDVVDEFRLWTFPVVVGGGKRLSGDGTTPGNLKVGTSTIPTRGVVMATYQRDGAVAYGSFALEEPTPAEVERRRQLSS